MLVSKLRQTVHVNVWASAAKHVKNRDVKGACVGLLEKGLVWFSGSQKAKEREIPKGLSLTPEKMVDWLDQADGLTGKEAVKLLYGLSCTQEGSDYYSEVINRLRSADDYQYLANTLLNDKQWQRQRSLPPLGIFLDCALVDSQYVNDAVKNRVSWWVVCFMGQRSLTRSDAGDNIGDDVHERKGEMLVQGTYGFLPAYADMTYGDMNTLAEDVCRGWSMDQTDLVLLPEAAVYWDRANIPVHELWACWKKMDGQERQIHVNLIKNGMDVTMARDVTKLVQ